jgi:hypothetical protein
MEERESTSQSQFDKLSNIELLRLCRAYRLPIIISPFSRATAIRLLIDREQAKNKK